MSHGRSAVLVLLVTWPAAVPPASAADVAPDLPLPLVPMGCTRWLLTLAGPAPDLAPLRTAVAARSAAATAAAIAVLERGAQQRAAVLTATLATDGVLARAAVVRAFWLVPVCVVDLPEAAAPALRAAPGVAALHRCAARPPW